MSLADSTLEVEDGENAARTVLVNTHVPDRITMHRSRSRAGLPKKLKTNGGRKTLRVFRNFFPDFCNSSANVGRATPMRIECGWASFSL